MTISNEQIAALISMLPLTSDVEEDCFGCLKKIAEFADHSLAGKSIPEGLSAIDRHLKICGECREEFEALKTALNTVLNTVLNTAPSSQGS